jgi:hypothetical protein
LAQNGSHRPAYIRRVQSAGLGYSTSGDGIGDDIFVGLVIMLQEMQQNAVADRNRDLWQFARHMARQSVGDFESFARLRRNK